MKRIVISNVACYNAPRAQGSMRNVEMSHVEIANAAADARPAFYLNDVDRADFFAVTAPRGTAGTFALKNLRIGWSRAAADTNLSSIEIKFL
jgi:hypothetical protein